MHDIDRTQAELEAEALELEDQGEAELEFEPDSEGRPFDEATELETAAELMEIRDDEELEQFLGDLARRAARTVSRGIRSPVGRAIGGTLRNVAKRALPTVGRLAGTAIGGPAGGAIGGGLGQLASGWFELELEGMSPEDRDFEVARRIVRLAGATGQRAGAMASDVPPSTAARAAIAAAARQHAPGLLRGGRSAVRTGRPSGRWVRQGRRIMLVGA